MSSNFSILNILDNTYTWLSSHTIFTLWLTFFIALLLLYVSLREITTYIRHIKLARSEKNPLLSPRSHQSWENQGTFNPAVIEDDEGRVHMFYRAIGDDGVSRVGHAVSEDGLHFNERSSYPVFVPPRGYGGGNKNKADGPTEYNPEFYTSGGGWAGSEDPRAVRMGEDVYMTYVAFEGWGSIRIALTSIKLGDVKNRRWDWKKPLLLSSPDSVNKNWVLFPEKIGGKFAILHGLSPKIMIDYIDDFNKFKRGGFIESLPQHYGHGYLDNNREEFWDNRTKGAGASPIRTDKGWLLLYHAVHDGKYKVGAMLLDLTDPARVLYRSPEPILAPEVYYENEGKPGVVYASGALVKNGRLLVYYGGGDRVVCIAETPLNELLGWLEEHGKVNQ